MAERWVILVIRKVLDRPAQVRYQRIVALAGEFRVIVVTETPLPPTLATIVADVHLARGGREIVEKTVRVAQRLHSEGQSFYVHTQYSPVPALAGFLAKRRSGCRWIYDLWDHPSLGWLHSKGPVRWVKRLSWAIVSGRMLPSADGWVIGMHPAVLAHLPPAPVTCRIITSRAGYLPEGAEQEKATPAPVREAVKVVYVGPVAPERGLDMMCQWAGQYRGPRAELHIVGRHQGRGTREMLSELVAICSRNDALSVQVWGELPHRQVLELLGDADIGLCPTDIGVLNYRFAFPVKVMEYMSRGLITVATEAHGTGALVVDGETGFLAKAGPLGFVDALNRALCLVQEPAMHGAMRDRARQRVAGFRWDEVNEVLVQDVLRVIGR